MSRGPEPSVHSLYTTPGPLHVLAIYFKVIAMMTSPQARHRPVVPVVKSRVFLIDDFRSTTSKKHFVIRESYTAVVVWRGLSILGRGAVLLRAFVGYEIATLHPPLRLDESTCKSRLRLTAYCIILCPRTTVVRISSFESSQNNRRSNGHADRGIEEPIWHVR